MSRAPKRQPVQTLARPSKKASTVKKAESFPLARLAAIAAQPRTARSPVGAWTLANIVSARDAQMNGQFERAVRIAEAMRTDHALHVARKNRLEAQKGINVEVEPAKDTGAARKVSDEAEVLYGEDGIGFSAGTAADIEGCLVDHGLAIGMNTYVPREDGSRVDLLHTFWPLEHVRRDHEGRLVARLHDWSEVPIVHGDGRWVVYAKHDDYPERQDAAVLSASLVWARHAFAERDWAKGSVAHGNPKVIGMLPAGMALQDSESGALTDEAAAMIELLRSIAQDDVPIGIKPAGAEIEYLVNTSQAWQVWKELVSNAEKAAARIYLGTDGILGSQGGAPGVDVDALFGVARTYIEGDLRCIERAFYSGVLVPWTAINFGDSSLAPHRTYQIPDVDGDAEVDARAKRNEALLAHIERLRAGGFVVTQDTIDALAEEYRVTAPQMFVVVEAEPVEGEEAAPVEAATVVAAPTPEEVAKAEAAFQAAIKAARENGFVIDQEWVDEAAKRYGVVVPRLPPSAEKAPTISLAPTDVVEWISPNEVRAASGLSPRLLADGTRDPEGDVQIRVIRKRDKAAEEAAKVAAEMAQNEAEREAAAEMILPSAPDAAPDEPPVPAELTALRQEHERGSLAQRGSGTGRARD